MWFFGLIVVLLIGAVAVVASGRWGAMSEAYDDRPDMTVPARQVLTAVDIQSARFGIGVRGYRMDEVDSLLERVSREVAERDRRIADLERAVAPIMEAPDGAGFGSRGEYDPAEFDDTGIQEPILVGGDFPEPEPAPSPAVPEDEPTQQPPEAPADADAAPEAGGGASDAAGTSESAGAAEAATETAGAEPEAEPPGRAQSKHSAAASEYERLQAEARALLEAQSQPGASRRTPAPQSPDTQQEPTQREQPEDTQRDPEQYRASAGPSAAPTPHWVLPEPVPQTRQQGSAAQQGEGDGEGQGQGQGAPGSERQEAQAPAAGEPADAPRAEQEQGQEQEWQFWPPADQQPSAPAWPVQGGSQPNGQADANEDETASEGHGGQGAYHRPN